LKRGRGNAEGQSVLGKEQTASRARSHVSIAVSISMALRVRFITLVYRSMLMIGSLTSQNE
jgi:hypothetical protein